MCACTRPWAAAGRPAIPPRPERHAPTGEKPPHEHTHTPRPTRRACAGGETRHGQACHRGYPGAAGHRPAGALVGPALPVDRPGGAGRCRWRHLFLAGAEREQRRARLRDRGPAQGQPHAQRVGQRHPAAHAGSDHRQRAVGYGQKRAGGRQRQGQKGAGAGRARHRQARCAGAALARLAGGCAGAAGAGGGHHQRGTGWLWPAARGGTPVGRQGAVGRRA
jgi:hypothetical protein